MKKMLCALLALLLLCPLALAEEMNPFAPYYLIIPEEATLTENEGTHTVVADMTRIVVTVIPRVPDAEPQQALIRMMGQFEPLADIGESLPLAEGFTGLRGQCKDKFGPGVDLNIVMILCPHGDLLILSAHDLTGDGDKALLLLDELLAGLTVEVEAILLVGEE